MTTSDGVNEMASNTANDDVSDSATGTITTNLQSTNVKVGKLKCGVDSRHHFSFSVRQKVKIVREGTRSIGLINKTCKKYKIQTSQFRTWRKKLPDLIKKCMDNPRSRTIHLGRQLDDNELQETLHDWIVDLRDQDIPVSTKAILAKAISLSPTIEMKRFVSVRRWVYKFMERFGLSIRRRTHVGQKLSGHLLAVKQNFGKIISQRFSTNGTLANVPAKFCLNMDQTAVFFESKNNTTVNKKGRKTVSVRDSGSNSKRCTVSVTIAADGTKLPLFYVFKGVPEGRIHKEMRAEGICGTVQEKGWFDERVLNEWVEQVLEPYVKDSDASFLLLDHFKTHLKKQFATKCAILGTDLDFIPAGYTCVLQPVDYGYNAPFKSRIRAHHENWCMTAYVDLGNDPQSFPTPSRSDIISWCEDAHKNITKQSIKETWKSIGYNIN